MYDLGLKDKVILITGGSDGLGYASAELLSSEGAHVVICGRRGDYLHEKAKIITEKTGNEVLPIKADVSNPDDCKKLVEGTIAKDGGFTNFTITDGNKDIEIIFDGFVPELFQENMGVILDGVFDNNTFLADDMLVKHDNEYVSSDGETYNVENYSE